MAQVGAAEDANQGLDIDGAADRLLGLLNDDLEVAATGGESGSQPQADKAAADPTDEEQPAQDEPEPENVEEQNEPGDEEEQEGLEEEPAEPETYEVVVDGQKERKTLDELRAGYSRTADYTRKTQALAKEKQDFETERTSVRGEREEYGKKLKILEDLLASGAGQEPDWEALRAEDPDAYAVAYTDWQRTQTQIRALRDEQGKVAAKNFEDAKKDFETQLQAGRDKLREAIPEWSDPKVAKAEKQALWDYATSLGYVPEQLALVTDHRLWLVLRDSMRYRNLKEKGKNLTPGSKRPDKEPPVKPLKPGTAGSKRTPSPAQRAFKRLTQSGSVYDAAAAIEGLE